MNDINKNKVPEEVRLKIEKLEKNVKEYNEMAITHSIITGIVLAGITSIIMIMLGAETVDDLSEISARIMVACLSGFEGWNIKRMADFVSKKNIAEDKIATLEEQYGIESERNSTKKRTRRR